MSRTIYIKSDGNARPKKVTDFEGTTFGELKAHVTDVNFENANVIIHSTKTTLFDDTSLIPTEGDVILLVVPSQMKAGNDELQVSDTDEFSDLTECYNELVEASARFNDALGAVGRLIVEDEENVEVGGSTLAEINRAFRSFLGK
jgi:hypothetical protein